MDVVVFGATGYLGGHIAQQIIAAGYSVKAIVRRGGNREFLDSLSCAVSEIDFSDTSIKSLITHDSYVVNCIADTRMHLSDRQRQVVEIDLTSRIFKLAEEAGAKRFIQLSTVMVYGADRPARAIDENYPLNPRYSYSRIARQREEVLLLLSAQCSMELIIVRPSNTLGSRDSSALPALMRSVEKGFYPVIDGGNWSYSNADARDVGRAFAHLIDIELSSTEIFLMRGYEMTWIELKQKIDDFRGKASHLLNIPKKIALGLGGVMEWIYPYGSSPPLTRFMVETMSNHALFDDSKLRRTGFNPRYELSDTIEDALRDYST